MEAKVDSWHFMQFNGPRSEGESFSRQYPLVWARKLRQLAKTIANEELAIAYHDWAMLDRELRGTRAKGRIRREVYVAFLADHKAIRVERRGRSFHFVTHSRTEKFVGKCTIERWDGPFVEHLHYTGAV